MWDLCLPCSRSRLPEARLVAASHPSFATATGETFEVPYPHEAILLGIDSSTLQFAGTAAPSAGAAMVATIFSLDGSVLMQDTVPGRVWDIEGSFAVGERDGKAAYWREEGGVWQVFHIEETPGVPADGELLTLDHRRLGLAGGYLVEGRPIVVDLRDNTWQEIEPELPVAPGTLYSVVGIDVHPITNRVALAVEATDFSGWDVTVDLPFTVLPGPGGWLAVAFLMIAIPWGYLRS